jgi:pyridoxine 4-dehydrogenase
MSDTISALSAGKLTIGDLTVNRMGYGAMRITGDGIWGEPNDRDNAIAVLQRAKELGINFIDTADAYGPEVSEKLIKEALYPYDGLLIATKGGLTRSGPGQWLPDCSPKHLTEACDASLQRLAVDHIDLYQLHTVDPNVAFEESYQAMLDLQAAGKIRYIGLSNIEPEHYHKAKAMGAFVSVQNNYNVTNREHEDVLKLCEADSIAFIPYFPIGGNQQGGVADQVLSDIASKYEVTERQVALAWILQSSPVTLPIAGTASLSHLEENIASATINLDDEDMRALNGLTKIS